MTVDEAANVAWDARVNWEVRPTQPEKMREALQAFDAEVRRLRESFAKLHRDRAVEALCACEKIRELMHREQTGSPPSAGELAAQILELLP